MQTIERSGEVRSLDDSRPRLYIPVGTLRKKVVFQVSTKKKMPEMETEARRPGCGNRKRRKETMNRRRETQREGAKVRC